MNTRVNKIVDVSEWRKYFIWISECGTVSISCNISIWLSGKACPDGMFLLNGKCVTVVKNSISNQVDNQNCRWKSNSRSYQVATIPTDTYVSL